MTSDSPTKTISTVEAVLETTTATVFSSGARVGMGRGVGVVGGGPVRRGGGLRQTTPKPDVHRSAGTVTRA